MKLTKTIKRDKYLKLAYNYQVKEEDLYLYGYQGMDCHNNQAKLKGMSKKGLHQLSPDNVSLCHHLSTTSGNSGSPIFIKRHGEIRVIALHNKGSDSL